MALTIGPRRALARRFSKITGAVALSILRAPSCAAARRPASAPTASGEGRSCRQRVERPSQPRSMPSSSPAMTMAETEEPVARCSPEKPDEVTSRQTEDDHPADPPSELVTRSTALAASSASRACASSISADGSDGSNRSRSSARAALSASLSAGASPA